MIKMVKQWEIIQEVVMKPINITMSGGKFNNTPTPEDIWQTSEMFINDYLDFPFNEDLGVLYIFFIVCFYFYTLIIY